MGYFDFLQLNFRFFRKTVLLKGLIYLFPLIPLLQKVIKRGGGVGPQQITEIIPKQLKTGLFLTLRNEWGTFLLYELMLDIRSSFLACQVANSLFS